jgi:hypothetical protein
MASVTSPSQLTGLFKQVYADDLENLIPEQAKVMKLVPFVPSDKETGDLYNQPVIVTQESGVTYAAYSDGAFDLNDPVAMNTQNAEVQGSQLLLRAALSYNAAAKASNSKKAFVKATELIVENMMESIVKRLEICFIYGGKGIGATTAAAVTATSATVTTLVFALGEWAAGIWAGLENTKVQFYLTSDLTTLVSSGADAIFTVSSVNSVTRAVAFTGTTTGSTALVSAAAASVTPFFYGSNGKEMLGLQKIFESSASYFNIDPAVYGLWKSNSVSLSGSLTQGKINQLLAQACARGLDEDVVCLVSPACWAGLQADQAALRMYDQSYSGKKSENGSEGIMYHSQNGSIEVISHSYVKNSHCFIFPPKRLRRIGAQDVSFKTPGMGDDIFLQLTDKAGFELRTYTDQAIFVETPARCVFGYGFTVAS